MAIGLARTRLSIPKVNSNPRPPKLANRIAAPRSMSAGALGGKKPAGLGSAYTAGGPGTIVNNALKGTATSTAQASNTSNPTPGSTSAASVIPAAPVASSERFAIPTWSATNAGEQDPRDSGYWSNLAKLRFTDEQEYGKNVEAESKENADYNYALQQAIQNRKIQERQLGESAIKGNLSASGWLGRTQAEQETTYQGERAHALFTHEHELQAYAAAKHALEEGYGIEAAALLGEAVGRRTEREEKEAERAAGEAGESAPESGGSNPNVSNPGPQKASAFSPVGLSNNKAVGQPQRAKAFAEAIKKAKK